MLAHDSGPNNLCGEDLYIDLASPPFTHNPRQRHSQASPHPQQTCSPTTLHTRQWRSYNDTAAMTAKPRHARRPSTLKCLVWTLRCLGLYCYKQPIHAAAADSTEPSLLLLLWVVFVKTYQVCLTVYHSALATQHETGDVGHLATTLNMTISVAFTLLGHTSLLINGSTLCQILMECEQQTHQGNSKKTSCLSTIFSVDKIISLLFYCSYAVTFLVPFTSLGSESIYTDGTVAAAQILFYSSTTASMMVTPMLFREVLVIASRQLNVEFLLDASFLRSGAAGPDPRLEALERIIRKVS